MCRLLAGKPERMGTLRGLRCRWKNNIKIDITYDGAGQSGLIWLKIKTDRALL
jgi:hypothetical protein